MNIGVNDSLGDVFSRELHRRHLANDWYVVRHGPAENNRRELIVSVPETGARSEWGLTPDGMFMTIASFIVYSSGLPRGEWAIISGQFARHDQTARLLAMALEKFNLLERPYPPGRLSDIIAHDPRANERRFGLLDMGPRDRYDEVWERDKDDPTDTKDHVQSVEEKRQEMIELVVEKERDCVDKKFMVVTSADPALFLELAFKRINVREAALAALGLSKVVTYIQHAEIRRLGSRGDNL